jgi:hypothetical protein
MPFLTPDYTRNVRWIATTMTSTSWHGRVVRRSSGEVCGSGGVIRNYNDLNYREIFFDRTKAGGKTS